VDGKVIFLGHFKNIEEAKETVIVAREKYKPFSNGGLIYGTRS
jgi:hypothetical protein